MHSHWRWELNFIGHWTNEQLHFDPVISGEMKQIKSLMFIHSIELVFYSFHTQTSQNVTKPRTLWKRWACHCQSLQAGNSFMKFTASCKPLVTLTMVEAAWWYGHVWLPGASSLLITADVTADRSSGLNSLLTFTQSFTVHVDNEQSKLHKATQEFLKAWNGVFFHIQVIQMFLVQ